MIPEAPRLFGAAQNPERHRALRATEEVLAELDAAAGDVNGMILRRGTLAFAHLFDAYAARMWITEAARLDAGSIDLMTPDAQRAEVVRVWEAFARFFRALNVCPYGWRPLRWALEDALGFPRSAEDRGVSNAEVSRGESEAHFKGFQWTRHENTDGVWFTPDGATWETGATGRICEYDRSGNPTDQCETVRLRASRESPWRTQAARWFAPVEAVRFGVSPYASEDAAGLGARPIGMPLGAVDNANNNTGEVHRLWLWNNGAVGVHPAMTDPAAHGFDPRASWNDDGLPIGPENGRRGAAYPTRPSGWATGDPSTPFVLPPSRWYFDLLRAPRAGLKLTPGGPDVSLVDYLLARGPEEIIREARRDVMLTNLLVKRAAQVQSDVDLFTRAQITDQQRQTSATTATLEGIGSERQSASTILGAVSTTAAAINPVVGVVVGIGSLLYQVGAAASEKAYRASSRFVDVFGRLEPSFEQFAIEDGRPNLVSALGAMGLPPGAPPDPEVARLRREANAREMARVARAVDREGLDGSRLFDPSLIRAGRRTVVLVGLDPAQGARVFVGAREFTAGLPEAGAAARWTEADGVPVWRFGVPADTPSIRVVYPDGRERAIDLAPPDPEGTPDARTAVVDATPPTPAELGALGFPARAVVLVGLDPSSAPVVYAGTRMVAQDPAPTGDAARWVDSTLPGVAGWMFGVPAGTREVRTLDAIGARVFPLAPMNPSLPDRDRVTVIDARRTSTQPLTAASSSKAPLVVGGLAALALGAWALTRRSR